MSELEIFLLGILIGVMISTYVVVLICYFVDRENRQCYHEEEGMPKERR